MLWCEVIANILGMMERSRHLNRRTVEAWASASKLQTLEGCATLDAQVELVRLLAASECETNCENLLLL
jgi:hypothetical protein